MPSPTFAALVLAALLATPAKAQETYVPLVLEHSGRLLDPTDKPLEGAVDITVRIYDRAGDPPNTNPTPPLWFETYTVTLVKGVYTISVGDTFGGKNALDADLFDSPDRYLAVKVGDDAEMQPRMRMGLMPYAWRALHAADAADALHADAADNAGNADRLGEQLPAAFSPRAGSTDLATLGTVTSGTWHAAPIADAYVASAAAWNDKAPKTGSTDIATLGTIATGVWQGTPVADAYVSSAAAWNGKLAAVAVQAPLAGSGTSGSALSIPPATTSADGYLSKADWARFDAAATATSGTPAFIQNQTSAVQNAGFRINGAAQASQFNSSIATGVAPFTVQSTTAVTNLNADRLDGMHFGGSFDPTADIKAYVDKLFCELHDGSYNSSNGTCDANMTQGTGTTYSNTACPSGYPRVCTLPEALRRTPLTNVADDWYWVAQEAGVPSTGNLDVNGSRYSFPYCPGTDAPLIYVATEHSRKQVINVICYANGYTPLCCK
jgi:hypothetical protein